MWQYENEFQKLDGRATDKIDLSRDMNKRSDSMDVVINLWVLGRAGYLDVRGFLKKHPARWKQICNT
jgi:hypothetical protein